MNTRSFRVKCKAADFATTSLHTAASLRTTALGIPLVPLVIKQTLSSGSKRGGSYGSWKAQ